VEYPGGKDVEQTRTGPARGFDQGARQPVGLGEFGHQHGCERAAGEIDGVCRDHAARRNGRPWAIGKIILAGGVTGRPETIRRRRDGMVG
jgi:hypothetical protein